MSGILLKQSVTKTIFNLIKLKSSIVYARYLKKITSINGMVISNNGRPLINILKKAIDTGGFLVNKGTIKVLINYMYFVSKLANKAGIKFAVIYLKSSFVALQQASGGHVLKDMSPLGCRVRRTRCGIPRLIPILHRQAILRGDYRYLRLWLTLFSIYRIMTFKGKAKLSSITDPGSMTQDVVDNFCLFLPVFFIQLRKKIGKRHPIKWPVLKARPFLIGSSTPVAGVRTERKESHVSILSTSPLGIIRSALLWKDHPLWPVLRSWCSKTRNIWVINRLQTIQANVSEKDLFSLSKKRSLGSLGFIEEAAGKVRIVAMVDCWTHWVLDPLMTKLSNLLKSIPNDGTSSQLSPLHRLMKISPKGVTYHCYDLSSATDRLPVILQVKILEPLIGVQLAELWRQLLVERDYIARSDTYSLDTTVKYIVGQPMGAKSSFHMMGLLHHVLVQWSAFRAGLVSITRHEWFDLYAIVGDDIVIADSLVAGEYVKIMAEIGVGIGLHKSLVSKTSLEFVKRTFFRGRDVSAVPLTEVNVATLATSQRIEFARKYKLSLAQFLSLGDFGYKVKGNLGLPLRKLGGRARDQIVQYFSPYGVHKYTIPVWLSMKTAQGVFYTWTDRKLGDATRSLLIDERNRLLDRLKLLDERSRPLWSYVTVKRDREWYGMIPHEGSRKTVFPYFVDRTFTVTKVPGEKNFIEVNIPRIDKVQIAFDTIKELVYREPFLDLLIKIRDLKLTIEDPREAMERGLIKKDQVIDLSTAWIEIWELEKQVNKIVPYADVFKKKESVFKETLSKTLKAWKKYSAFARSTRSL